MPPTKAEIGGLLQQRKSNSDGLVVLVWYLPELFDGDFYSRVSPLLRLTTQLGITFLKHLALFILRLPSYQPITQLWGAEARTSQSHQGQPRFSTTTPAPTAPSSAYDTQSQQPRYNVLHPPIITTVSQLGR